MRMQTKGKPCIYDWWGCKIFQPLQKTTDLACDLSTNPGYLPKGLTSQQLLAPQCLWQHIHNIELYHQPRCSSTREWIKIMQCVCTMEVMPFARKQIQMGIILLSETELSEKVNYKNIIHFPPSVALMLCLYRKNNKYVDSARYTLFPEHNRYSPS